MNMSETSFKTWLLAEIRQSLGAKSANHLVFWCDPERVWKPLLERVAEGADFELWAEEKHELLLRDRLLKAPPAPRVVWLPCAREEIGYLRVFELRAADVKTWSLPEALRGYGVELTSEQLVELRPLLAAHTQEWLDRPRVAWKELTPGHAKGVLMDDDRMLEILATPGSDFDALVKEDRFSLFARRVKEDFGLPEPKPNDADAWRIQALTALLCTDAAAKCPEHPPGEQARIVPPGALRERALRLLGRWQKQVDLLAAFEQLAPKADALTSLQFWARNLERLPATALASSAAEHALFEREVAKLGAIESFSDLAKALETQLTSYQAHDRGFWGNRAMSPVLWRQLGRLAVAAGALAQNAGAEKLWKKTTDAVGWFTACGWEVDHQAEKLFSDDLKLPGGLVGVLAKLRRAYLRHLDASNGVFSELLANEGVDALGLSFAGDVMKPIAERASTKEPVAILVLDACRYDAGCRLAEMLNSGEPARRAEVSSARAPLPSITAIGMPFCLPGDTGELRASVEDGKICVTASGFAGNLSDAAQRRAWLKQKYKLKDGSFLSVEQAADSTTSADLSAKTLGKLVFVFADELDDHDCWLKPFGLDQNLERYATVIRRLRAAGYNTVHVVTDHGSFYWDPAPDEKDTPKPEGDIRFASRRAIVGSDLKHASALCLPMTGSQLQCCVPRSVNTFKTYGRIGFFHGGATLQELVTPVLTIRWPRKAKKTDVVLKPITQITSLMQRVDVAPAAAQTGFFDAVDETLLTRTVRVKVCDTATGKALFKGKATARIEPGGGSVSIELAKVAEANAKVGTELEVVVEDADNDELLERRPVTLKVELNDWD
jgi:hypothetical protein